MRTIREVFSYNLKRLRGDMNQGPYSARLGIPLSTLQKWEAGKGSIPQKAKMKALVAALGIETETELFLDPDLVKKPDLETALKVIAEANGFQLKKN